MRVMMMTAKTAGFVSRSEMNMLSPTGVSHNITPEQGGCAVHHGGPGPKPAPTTLAKAIEVWKGWQEYHMKKKGWNDIAYTLGISQTGHVLAGRGIGVRTAAQGSDMGNDDYYAVVWIGGGGDKPTQAALDAFDWAILHLRNKGRAGDRVRPHKDFTGTTCPDLTLTTFAKSRDNRVIYSPVPLPPKPKPEEDMKIVQVTDKDPQYLSTGTHLYWLEDGKAKANALKVFPGLNSTPVEVPNLRGLGVLVGPTPPVK